MYKPNFNLKITDLDTAIDYLKSDWPDYAVTLLGPARNEYYGNRIGQPKPDLKSTGKHHLRVVIDDITYHADGWETPDIKHAEQVLKHTSKIKEGDNVLIHCRAGVSRSTATSIAVLVQHGAEPDDAISYVEHIRPILDPNELMIINYDAALGQEGALYGAYLEWVDRSQKMLFSRIPEVYDSILDYK